MASNEDTAQGDDLCDVMFRLKMKNPELNRKQLHLAVQADGLEWQGVTFESIKRNWKKMVKQTLEEKENCKKNRSKNIDTDRMPSAGASSDENYTPGMTPTASSSDGNSSPSRENTLKEWRNAAYGTKGLSSKSTTLQNEEAATAHQNEMHATLDKQLQYLKKYPSVNYILFTPDGEAVDHAVTLTHPFGELFFNVLWQRVIDAPHGSSTIRREMWLIFQALEKNFDLKHKKMLRKQLTDEFGIDPFSGRP